jgi:hypothetical protein
MESARHWRSVMPAVSLMVLCSIGLQSILGQVTGPSGASGAIVRWSAPTNGLAIGLEVPRKPLLFTPQKGWNGQTVVRRYDAEGRLTGASSSPGGKWHSGAQLVVHLRNTTAHELLWSDFFRIWGVTFAGDNFAEPDQGRFLGGPAGDIPPHRRVPPNGETTIEIAIARAYRIWPAITEGTYRVAVVYEPIDLYHTQIGDGTKQWRPFQAPGFWQGRISTPTVQVQVRHSQNE